MTIMFTCQSMHGDVYYIDLLPCERQLPCQNGGSCTNNGRGGYTCSCSPGYHGTNCETETNECLPTPCQNGGTCIVSHCYRLLLIFLIVI